MWQDIFKQTNKANKNQSVRDELVEYFLMSMLPYAAESWNFTPFESDGNLMFVTEKAEETEAVPDKNGFRYAATEVTSEMSELEPSKSRKRNATPSHLLSSLSASSFLSSESLPLASKSTLHTLNSLPFEERYMDSSHISEISWKNSNGCFIKFRNGNTYVGKFKGLNFDGYGIYRWSDGSSYKGKFRNSRINGEGIMIWPDLSWYQGQFTEGYRHGFGTFYLAFSPIVYHGEWSWGERHGKGFLLYSDNTFYDGEWSRNYREGEGELLYPNGCHYFGRWSFHQRNGFGILCWPNNDCYKGNWLNGEMHDYGEYVWNAVKNMNFYFPVENVYRGNWKHGLRDGIGKLEFGFINCGLYYGQFRSNLKHGDGKIICGNGRVIDGKPLFFNDKPIHLASNDLYATFMNTRNSVISENSSAAPKRVYETTKYHGLLYFQCAKTIEIPIHVPMYEIDFTYHLKKAYKQLFPYPKDGEKIQSNLESHKLQCFEKTIKQNLLILWKIYNYYSRTGCVTITQRPCIMVRLSLWQFYRDCNINKKMSLVKIDKLLYACDNILLETIHHPFERIYFWQFLHSLFCVAWSLYSYPLEGGKGVPDSIVFTFTKLLELDIYPFAFKNNGFLFKYLDIVPLTAMYKHYQDVGEPLSIRKFLKRLLSATVKYSRFKDLKLDDSMHYNGKNTVNFGTYIEYKPVETNLEDPINRLTYEPICESHIFFEMLQVLKVNDLINIMIYVCPLIEEQSHIVKLDYELTFLEYFEIIICCLHIYYDICKSKRILNLLMYKYSHSDRLLSIRRSCF